MLGLGQAGARNTVLHPGLPHGGREPSTGAASAAKWLLVFSAIMLAQGHGVASTLR